MKEFRCLEDVEQAGLSDDVFRIVHGSLRELIECHEKAGFEFNSESDGYTVLVESGDTDAAVREAIGCSLLEASWDGVSLRGGLFLGVLMRNNQFGISVFVEDGPHLDPAVRARLMSDV